MKNFRWVTNGLFLFLSLILSLQLVRASDVSDNEPDPKKLALLQIHLSVLQIIWLENPVIPAKQASGEQYLSLAEARGFKDCLYFFSLHADLQKYKLEDYNGYFEVLKNPKYKEKVISPIKMRVLGVYGHDRKDYYQGTYEIRHEGLPPFRFHALAIEQAKAKQFDKGVAFYILNTISKKDSAQLTTLCKEEYQLTGDGKLSKDIQKRWILLKDLIGENTYFSKPKTDSEEPKVKTKRKFTQRNKKSDISQEKEPEACPSQDKNGGSAFVSVMSKNPFAASSSEQEKRDIPLSEKQEKKHPSPSGAERRKGNFSLLDEETGALLEEMRKSQIKIKENSAENASSPTSTQESPSIPNASIAGSSSQTTVTEKSKDNTATGLERRGRNRAFTEDNSTSLLKKK